MLPLLARLYGLEPALWPEDGTDEGHPARPAARAQGREHDTDVRRAIEQYAEDHAAAYFERQKWQSSAWDSTNSATTWYAPSPAARPRMWKSRAPAPSAKRSP